MWNLNICDTTNHENISRKYVWKLIQIYANLIINVKKD